MDAHAVVPAAEGGDGGVVLHGPQQRIVIADGHHDVGKAGGDDLGGEAVRTVRGGETVGAVQLRQLLRRQGAQQLGRGHVHPHRVAGDGDGQVARLGVGDMVAVADFAQLAQQGEGGHGGMAAQLHLPGRGEVAQRDAPLPHRDKGGLRVLELPGDLGAEGVVQRSVRQHHAGLVAAEHPAGKGIHYIGFHGRHILSLRRNRIMQREQIPRKSAF